MCYTDLMADKDNPEEEEEPPRTSLGSPILDTCLTAVPLLAQIEMDPSWRRIKMMNHALGMPFYRSLDMLNELMQMNPRPFFMDDLIALITREQQRLPVNCPQPVQENLWRRLGDIAQPGVPGVQPGLCLHCLRPEADCRPTACPTLAKETITPAVIPEIYRELFMPEASDKDVMMWFPAVVAESPHLSFSILSAATNRRSHEQMKAQGKRVLFMATEAWLGQLNDSYGAATSHIQDRIEQ